MIVTNKYHYPDALVSAVKADLYKPQPNVLRVTELIDPPLIKHLKTQHWDKIAIDIDDCLPMLFGTAWHAFVARWVQQYCPSAIPNRIWLWNYDGLIIKGETDIYYPEGGVIEDIKVTSPWSFIFIDQKEKWGQQLNCYAYLIDKNGYPVTQLMIHAFLEGWSFFEANKQGNWDYPKHRYHTKKIQLWPTEQRETFIKERIALFKNEPVECSFKEKWGKKSTWAVKHAGVQKADKVCQSVQEARTWVATHTKKEYIIEERLGEFTRCERYCSVSNVCPYFKRSK